MNTYLPHAHSLPPGISADVVLDILKIVSPHLYAQVCDFVSAHYYAIMADQFRRDGNFKANIKKGTEK